MGESKAVLVLGPSGGCGRWFCRLAAARGWAVTTLVRPETSFDVPVTRVLRGNVLDEAFLRPALAGNPVVVCCLGIKRAAPSNPWSNVVSPVNLCTLVSGMLRDFAPAAGVSRVLAISAAGVGDKIGRA